MPNEPHPASFQIQGEAPIPAGDLRLSAGKSHILLSPAKNDTRTNLQTQQKIQNTPAGFCGFSTGKSSTTHNLKQTACLSDRNGQTAYRQIPSGSLKFPYKYLILPSS